MDREIENRSTRPWSPANPSSFRLRTAKTHTIGNRTSFNTRERFLTAFAKTFLTRAKRENCSTSIEGKLILRFLSCIQTAVRTTRSHDEYISK